MNEVRVFGLGTRIPEETTIEALMAIDECAVVFSALEDPKASAWLKKRVPGVKRFTGPELLVKAAKAGGPVGLAVWGHPQFSSAAARSSQAALAVAGVPVRIYGAVSPIGSVFARSVSFLGGDYGYQGVQAYELETLLADPSRWAPRLPLVAYAEAASSARWKALKELLAEKLPASHELRVYPVGADEERKVKLAAFPGLKLGGAAVFVTPAAGAPKRPHDMAK